MKRFSEAEAAERTAVSVFMQNICVAGHRRKWQIFYAMNMAQQEKALILMGQHFQYGLMKAVCVSVMECLHWNRP